MGRAIKDEFGGIFDVRRSLINQVPRLLPIGFAGRTRAQIYRSLGIAVGPKTLIMGALTLGARSRPGNLRIGSGCYINSTVYIDAAAPVHLGDRVSVGHHVIIITSDHSISTSYFRAGTVSLKPVVVGEGSWIAARATLLPGVTVGAGAVVAAGAVVTRDVAPNTLVGGVPARLIRRLDISDD